MTKKKKKLKNNACSTQQENLNSHLCSLRSREDRARPISKIYKNHHRNDAKDGSACAFRYCHFIVVFGFGRALHFAEQHDGRRRIAGLVARALVRTRTRRRFRSTRELRQTIGALAREHRANVAQTLANRDHCQPIATRSCHCLILGISRCGCRRRRCCRWRRCHRRYWSRRRARIAGLDVFHGIRTRTAATHALARAVDAKMAIWSQRMITRINAQRTPIAVRAAHLIPRRSQVGRCRRLLNWHCC